MSITELGGDRHAVTRSAGKQEMAEVRRLSILALAVAAAIGAGATVERRELLRDHSIAVLDQELESAEMERRVAVGLRAGVAAIDAGEDMLGAMLAISRADAEAVR